MGNFCKRRQIPYDDNPYNDDIYQFKKRNKRKRFDSNNEEVKERKFIPEIKGGNREESNTEKNNSRNIFLESCNNFLKHIKINQDEIKIEFGTKKTLYDKNGVLIEVSAKMESGLYNLSKNLFNIEFKNSEPTNDKSVKNAINSISKEFKVKGVDLESDYSLFTKKVGEFMVDGNLYFKFYTKEENSVFACEFKVKVKKDGERFTSSEFYGVLALEITFKKKPYFIRLKNKRMGTLIIASTIANLLIFSYEDKIPLVIEFLDKISDEGKNKKEIDVNKLMNYFGNYEDLKYS